MKNLTKSYQRHKEIMPVSYETFRRKMTDWKDKQRKCGISTTHVRKEE